ncbi:hypothetical protein H2203_000439 [Taxawa tesnikishii (nom. ined.)]|nr:hypothetical protein H2203_000439 [Dothideales sp. JES 119]
MDIWAPANSKGKKLPVMVWTYGGGLANGPTLNHEGGTSNLALWDVQYAFQWTKKHISAFGGDPNEMTAVGFSAGGSHLYWNKAPWY